MADPLTQILTLKLSPKTGLVLFLGFVLLFLMIAGARFVSGYVKDAASGAASKALPAMKRGASAAGDPDIEGLG